MARPRHILGHLLAAVLVWMSVVAGVMPRSAFDPATLVQTGPHGTMAGHHGHATGDDDPLPHSKHHELQRSEKTLECIATCLDLIADKLIPETSSTVQKATKAVPVNWMQLAATGINLREVRFAHWPTGPPIDRLRSGSGTERLVALNSRLRN